MSRLFRFGGPPPNLRPRYNVAPTQQIPIVRAARGDGGDRELAARGAELKELRQQTKEGPLRNVDGLVRELDPLLEGLLVERTKNMATIPPGTVAALVVMLERAMVRHGIMPESRRTADPIRYTHVLIARRNKSPRRP